MWSTVTLQPLHQDGLPLHHGLEARAAASGKEASRQRLSNFGRKLRGGVFLLRTPVIIGKRCVLCAAHRSCCRDSSWAAVLMCCRCTNAALLLSSRCVAGRRTRHGTSARGRRSKLTAASGAATPSAAAQPQATPLPPLRPQALQPHPPLPCIQGLVCRAFSWTISMSSA